MDEAARVQRKDTVKGPPLRVLSLDGGGVRGYSIFIILQELMHRTFVEIHGRAPKREEIPKPCDHFDLIAGNGTGGLIAIMLGRLRLDIDTCKDVYVRMTRRVFETDKTFAGIPYRHTLFKASKMEEAIRECVREHTIFEDEGNDSLANATPMSSPTPMPQRTMSQSSKYSSIGQSPTAGRASTSFSYGAVKFGKPDALLYDTRENRTKTAVTAVYKGAPPNAPAQLLRSYDSRREPAPDVNCTIWQAGRATSAVYMAFKPIKIGQTIYIDEGVGKYNPAPQVLDEAVVNEWPGRELGVFVSIGTGKPTVTAGDRQNEWWEGVLGSAMGDFAEARRRLVRKIEACEDTHQYMQHQHLARRGVNPENYYRLNVEVGVGDFGLNEWARLGDISTSTRQYLSRNDVQSISLGAAAKLARIHFAKIRHGRVESRDHNRYRPDPSNWPLVSDRPLPPLVPPPESPTMAELPGDDHYQPGTQGPGSADFSRGSIDNQKYSIDLSDVFRRSPSRAVNVHSPPPSRGPGGYESQSLLRRSLSSLRQAAALPPQRQSPIQPHAHPQHQGSYRQPSRSGGAEVNGNPLPPIPPKTPLPYPTEVVSTSSLSSAPTSPWYATPGEAPTTFMNMGELGRRLPYPDQEEPPPTVNYGTKPQVY